MNISSGMPIPWVPDDMPIQQTKLDYVAPTPTLALENKRSSPQEYPTITTENKRSMMNTPIISLVSTPELHENKRSSLSADAVIPTRKRVRFTDNEVKQVRVSTELPQAMNRQRDRQRE